MRTVGHLLLTTVDISLALALGSRTRGGPPISAIAPGLSEAGEPSSSKDAATSSAA